jgi:carbohydrate-selective porin OprB
MTYIYLLQVNKTLKIIHFNLHCILNKIFDKIFSKHIIFFLYFFLSNFLVYSQHLKSSPFSFKLGYIIDYVDILSGEGKSGRGFLGNIDLKMNFETSKASLWKNGNFFIYVLGNHGIKPTKDNLGGIQTFDNIETEDKIQLFQFYYRHKINNFSLTIGQSNIDEYFFTQIMEVIY